MWYKTQFLVVTTEHKQPEGNVADLSSLMNIYLSSI